MLFCLEGMASSCRIKPPHYADSHEFAFQRAPCETLWEALKPGEGIQGHPEYGMKLEYLLLTPSCTLTLRLAQDDFHIAAKS